MQTLVAAAAAAAPLQLEPQKLSKFRKGKCYRINLCRDTNLDSNHHIEEKKESKFNWNTRIFIGKEPHETRLK